MSPDILVSPDIVPYFVWPLIVCLLIAFFIMVNMTFSVCYLIPACLSHFPGSWKRHRGPAQRQLTCFHEIKAQWLQTPHSRETEALRLKLTTDRKRSNVDAWQCKCFSQWTWHTWILSSCFPTDHERHPSHNQTVLTATGSFLTFGCLLNAVTFIEYSQWKGLLC